VAETSVVDRHQARFRPMPRGQLSSIDGTGHTPDRFHGCERSDQEAGLTNQRNNFFYVGTVFGVSMRTVTSK